jgi:hypothetical protein
MSKEDFMTRLLDELKKSQDYLNGRASTVASVIALEDALEKLEMLRQQQENT